MLLLKKSVIKVPNMEAVVGCRLRRGPPPAPHGTAGLVSIENFTRLKGPEL